MRKELLEKLIMPQEVVDGIKKLQRKIATELYEAHHTELPKRETQWYKKKFIRVKDVLSSKDVMFFKELYLNFLKIDNIESYSDLPKKDKCPINYSLLKRTLKKRGWSDESKQKWISETSESYWMLSENDLKKAAVHLLKEKTRKILRGKKIHAETIIAYLLYYYFNLLGIKDKWTLIRKCLEVITGEDNKSEANIRESVIRLNEYRIEFMYRQYQIIGWNLTPPVLLPFWGFLISLFEILVEGLNLSYYIQYLNETQK
ncbi:MAG: hypothetical protein N2738_06295 [Thermodesulfovibrionales bacterium]|nr:hypothetical protein [Thermodesulfovibrionales bacterium]